MEPKPVSRWERRPECLLWIWSVGNITIKLYSILLCVFQMHISQLTICWNCLDIEIVWEIESLHMENCKQQNRKSAGLSVCLKPLKVQMLRRQSNYSVFLFLLNVLTSSWPPFVPKCFLEKMRIRLLICGGRNLVCNISASCF